MAEVDELDQLLESTGNSLLDRAVHIGLLIGAVFQLVCIFAVIFIPVSADDKEYCSDVDVGRADEDSSSKQTDGHIITSAAAAQRQTKDANSQAYKRREKKKKR